MTLFAHSCTVYVGLAQARPNNDPFPMATKELEEATIDRSSPTQPSVDTIKLIMEAGRFYILSHVSFIVHTCQPADSLVLEICIKCTEMS